MEAIETPVCGGRFRARAWTGGRGAPLIYLHDVLGPMSGAPFLEALAERFTVFAPAHPGFDSTNGADELEGVGDLALYYRDFIDALGIEKPHLIGHSLGGMIAAEMAALAPDRMGRLVLACSLGLWMEDVPIPDFFSFNARQLVRSALHDPDGPVGVDLLRRFEEPDRTLDSLPQAASLRRLLSPNPEKGLRQRIHHLTLPTLLVWGASDGLVPAPYGEAFRRCIPGSTLEVLNGAGHFPMLEQPEAFLEAVIRFLA